MAYSPETLIPIDFRKEWFGVELDSEDVQQFLSNVKDESITDTLRDIVTNKTAGSFTNMLCVNNMSTEEINNRFIEPKEGIDEDDNNRFKHVNTPKKFLDTSIKWNCVYDSDSINNDQDTIEVDEVITDIGVGNYPREYKSIEEKEWIGFANDEKSVCVTKGFIGYDHKPQYAFAMKNSGSYYIGIFDVVDIFYAEYVTDMFVPIKPKKFIVYSIGGSNG